MGTLKGLSQRTDFAGATTRALLALRRREVNAPRLDNWRFPGATAQPYNANVARSIVKHILDHAPQINEAASMFSDDQSRALLQLIFAFRALGPRHVQLPKSNPQLSKWFEDADQMRVGRSQFEFPPFEVARYRVSHAGENIEIECWLGNIVLTFLERQYYFSRSGTQIGVGEGDVVIDAGACFGDTALAFAASVGPNGFVHSFDPLPQQRAFYGRNQERNPRLAGRIRVYPFALDEVSGKSLSFVDGGAGARAQASGTIPAETCSVDDFVLRENLQRVDFIKMDIEGAERAALKGAMATIKKYKPKLAISIYHSLEDLTYIPRLIGSIEPCYRLFLDHHTIHEEETVLYAIANEMASMTIGSPLGRREVVE
jgi:FkbM family methyltransferase